ncbi:peptide synthetase, partial [Peribacillus sp. SIMBA_075]
GDLVQLDPTGLFYRGRADDQVKLGGRRIELGEVEAALQDLPGVSGAAAAVRRSSGGNDVLVGYLAVPDRGMFDRRASLDQLRATLPPL